MVVIHSGSKLNEMNQKKRRKGCHFKKKRANKEHFIRLYSRQIK